MRTKQSGFTLVEVMVVVAIIAIISALLMGANSRSYGASAKVTADQVTSTLNFVKMRASSTRRIHTVQISPNEISVWESTITGFKASAATPTLVTRTKLEGNAKIWNVDTAVKSSSGNTVTMNASLNTTMTFKPDGSSSGGTIYVTDNAHSKEYRVLVYKATGSSYAKQTW
jgi:prepilin-type N-terminal cleavage/methylation domain-containing protein